jgi:hypothetical protein
MGEAGSSHLIQFRQKWSVPSGGMFLVPQVNTGKLGWKWRGR